MGGLTNILVLAQAEAHGEEEGGAFLVEPGLGLMIWTLIAFLATYFILKKFAFPRIQDALEKRANAVAESIDAAHRTREEADELLHEYRERLREAREQAEDIVARARQASERFQDESKGEAKRQREEMIEQTRRDIEQETRRALGEIRREVADLTIAATEKVIRKSLDADGQKRLVEEALQEVDFSALSGENGKG